MKKFIEKGFGNFTRNMMELKEENLESISRNKINDFYVINMVAIEFSVWFFLFVISGCDFLCSPSTYFSFGKIFVRISIFNVSMSFAVVLDGSQYFVDKMAFKFLFITH